MHQFQVRLGILIKNKAVIDKRIHNTGRPVPGYTVNPDGTIVTDHQIVTALIGYRDRRDFSNGGGYTKLTHCLRRDYHYHVNRKKVYRLCEKHALLLPKQKKRNKGIRKRCSTQKITCMVNKDGVNVFLPPSLLHAFIVSGV